MKLLAALISLITLFIYVWDEVEHVESDIDKSNQYTKVAIPMLEPLPDTLLAFEDEWRTSSEQKTTKKEPEEKSKLDRTQLKIGDNNYQLIAIFKENSHDFILLKSGDLKLLKLAQNDTLPGGYTLTEINANMIAFTVNNNRVEYKLFELKSYDEN